MVCGNFILPEFCKLCLFSFLRNLFYLIDKCLGMLEAVGEVFPEAKYQRCTVRFYRNVFSVTPRSKVKLVAKRCSKDLLRKLWRSMLRRAKKPPGRRRKQL